MNRVPTLNNSTTGDNNNKIILQHITWNVWGWGGQQDNVKKKIIKIKSDLEGYSIVILTKTYLSRDIDKMKKLEKYMQEFSVHHVHDRHRASGQKGISIGIRKILLENNNIHLMSDEREEDKEQWICMTLTNVLDKLLCIWGIYAPTIATVRRK